MNYFAIIGILALSPCITSLIKAYTSSSVTACHGSLHADGLRWESEPNRAAYDLVPGPKPGIVGIIAHKHPFAVTGTLDTVVQGPGSLSFWFATDRVYRSGIGEPTVNHKLIEVRDSFSISLNADSSSITMLVEWGGPQKIVFPRHLRIILPEFPGPAWHHFAVSWNGATGEINAYLDGTPYYVAGEKLAPLNILPGQKLLLHLGSVALADVRLKSTQLAPSALDTLVTPAYKGRFDRLLGALSLGTIHDVPALRGKVIYDNPLASSKDTAGWVLEGPGDITLRDGWMTMKSKRPDGPEGHVVYWCPKKFPDRIVAEWEFEFLEEKGLCIAFFAARGRGNKDLFDTSLSKRSGVFGHYINGDIDCYHISYFANSPSEPRGVANLRKNHGFFLISNGPVGVPVSRPGEVHRAVLIKDGAHIRMAVDGRIIIDHIDDGRRAGPVYTDGYIGFRQMQWTHARYRNFRVSTLKH